MKFIEKTLADLNSQNLQASIKEMVSQIRYFEGKNRDIEGISLIPVRDLLSEEYSAEALRANGYILTLAQFKEDAEKALELARKDPILHNAKLKRLHRSYCVFKQSFAHNMIHNQAVLDEISTLFSAVILNCYAKGTHHQGKMPRELIDRIADEIGRGVEELNESWYQQSLSDEANNEFMAVLLSKLHQDWQEGKLTDGVILKQLEKENNLIKKEDEFLSYFHDKKLPNELQNRLFNAVKEEILKDIYARKITAVDEVGLALKNIEALFLDGNYPLYVGQLIENWQKSQTTEKVASILEKYIMKVIDQMKDSLEASFSQMFSEIAVRNLLHHLQHNDSAEELLNAAKEYSLELAKQLDDLPKCKEEIFHKVMQNLSLDWMHGKLKAKENNFIEENVFFGLNEVDKKVCEQTWRGDYSEKTSRLEEVIAQQTIEIQSLKELFQKLANDLRRDSVHSSEKENQEYKGPGLFSKN